MKRMIMLLFMAFSMFSATSQNITAAEYFFDSDPGNGNGIPITVSSPGEVVNINTSISTASLSAGFHFLGIRVRNSDGTWSHFEKRGFYITSSIADMANITAAEYFFDADPGQGNGIPLATGAIAGIVNFNAAIPTSLSNGFHFLSIRVKDGNGTWSQFEKRGFYITSTSSNAADITAAEYFLDADPGLGNGTPLSVGTAGSVVNFTAVIPTSLSPGFHFLAIRSKGSDGTWGLFEKRGFYISGTPTNTGNIVAAEYFIDTDPGPGNGSSLPVGVSGATVNFSPVIPTNVAPGFHFLAIRTKNSDGNWGLFEKRGFYVSQATADAPSIVAAEYFINTDPGPGNATPLSVTAGAVVNQSFLIPDPGLPLGSHNLTIRVKGADGKWGLFEYRQFVIGNSTISCHADTVAATAPGECTLVMNNIDPVVSPPQSFTYTLSGATTGTGTGTASGQVFNAGVTTVNYALTGSPTVNCSFTVTVNAVAPNITLQPSSQTKCAGENVTFSVTATGSSLLYQWRKNGISVPGANSSSYTINSLSVSDAANYDVVVSTSCATQVISAAAVLTVNTPPAIAVHPAGQTVCPGTSINFSVTATGSGLTYQWRKDGNNIAGANASTFNISNVNAAAAGSYDVIVSGVCPLAATSNPAVLVVNVPPSITIQPTNQTRCLGESVSFNVSASGTGLTYQWRKAAVNIPGANSNVYTISNVAVSDAGSYDVVVSGTCPSPVTSQSITLTVNTPPVINTQPVSQAVCSGSAATFTVGAGGTSLTYQWRKGGLNIPGATSSSYSISAAATVDAGNYDVVISGICGTATSATVVLTIQATTQITVQPVSVITCAGSGAVFSVSATGTGTLNYQWKRNGVDIAGANASTYSIASASAADAGNYSVAITGVCGTDISVLASLTVNALTAITMQPTNQSSCIGGSVTFSVGATGSGVLSYQWKKNGTDIGGASSSSYSVLSVSAADAGSYSVVVTGNCGTVTSNIVSLSVSLNTVINTQPTSQSACAGSTVSFLVSASGSGTLTYQWKKNGVDIGGANAATYTIASVTISDAGDYSVTATSSCGTVSSNLATLTILPATVITSQPVNVSACLAGNATFTVAASGNVLTYQWRKGGVNIAGATSSSYTITGVNAGDAASYDVIVTGTCGSVTSNAVSLVIGNISITTQPVSQVVCAGVNVSFTVAATGSGLVYQWRQDGINITAANSSVYNISNVSPTGAGNYDVVVSGTCGSVTSSIAVLAVNTAPSITVQPVTQSVCAGNSVSFSVSALGTGLTYQWRKGTLNIPGANSNVYSISSVAVSDGGSYDVVVSGTCPSPVTSLSVTLTVNTPPVITTQPVSQIICAGVNVSFFVTATGSGISYQWRKDGNNIAGANASIFSISNVIAADVGSYDVIVSGTCAPAVISNPANLVVNISPSITIQPASETRCPGESVSFSVSGLGTGISYQWRKGGVNIAGANSATYTIAAVSAVDVGNYDVVVSGTCSPAVTSNIAALTVLAPPTVTTQPQSQVSFVGASATFSVTANGNGLSYQWRKNGVNISGATSASYTINNIALADAGNYDVVVSGTCPPAVTSNTAVLTVNSVTISQQPVNTSACAGSNAAFIVVANGPNLSYQWQVSTGGGVFTNIAGATTATLSLNAVSLAMNGNQYRCVISGSLNSNVVTLTVHPLPVVTLVLNIDTVYRNSAQQQISGGLPAGGVYSGTGISTGGFLPSAYAAGNYNVSYRYTDANGCTNSATDAFTILPAAAQVNLYPNPALDGRFTLVVSDNLAGGEAAAFNSLGQVVMQWPVIARYLENHVKWPAGVYTIRIRKGDITESRQLIITR